MMVFVGVFGRTDSTVYKLYDLKNLDEAVIHGLFRLECLQALSDGSISIEQLVEMSAEELHVAIDTGEFPTSSSRLTH